MNAKIGLKLWAPNIGGYLREAVRLHDAGVYDYVELYSSPDSTTFIPHWQKLNVPFVIHCAHSLHGFNLSDPSGAAANKKMFAEAVDFFWALSARWIIVHPGIGGTVDETMTQLQLLIKEFSLPSEKILVENKPFINLLDQPCVGGAPEAIARLQSACGTGTVLDIGHAIKYGLAAGRPWESVLRQFMTLSPQMLHVSDALMSHPKDEHLHLGTAEFDFDTIFCICAAPYISIETVKDDPEKLDDFVMDVAFLKRKLI